MAKSKDQKRKEAIERAKAALPGHRIQWQKYQQGGSVYEATAKVNKNYAEQLRTEADRILDHAAARAHTDRHGNPV